MPVPANDNDRPAFGVWRDGRMIYRLADGERVTLVGLDKLIIVHPDREPKLISAIDGSFIGTVRA